MSQQIDRAGAFRGKPVETGVGTTKNGFPRFVARIVATQRYVEDAEELKALGIEGGPQWVDWSGYEQEITGYLTLLGAADKANPAAGMKKLDFQFDALNRALGWDGASFSVLGSTDYSEKEVTFWVEDHEYPAGTFSLQVSGIDAGDADPNQSIRTLDAGKLKDLDAQFAGHLGGGAAKAAPAASAKGGAKAPPKGAPGKPASSAPAAAKPSSAPTASAPTAAPKGPPKKPAAPAPAKTEEPPFNPDVPAEMDQGTAWEYVLANRGKATDDATAEKWLDACGKVCPGKAEDAISGVEYRKIADVTIAALKA